MTPLVLLVLAEVSGPISAALDWLDGDLLTLTLRAFIILANLAGGLVIGVALVRALATYLFDLISRQGDVPKESIRLTLGRSLALALEFQLAADILGTALNPTLRDIGLLAAIVILRTLLNYFLGKEIDAADQRAGRVGGAT
jgi:uncharacterized membrane protein